MATGDGGAQSEPQSNSGTLFPASVLLPDVGERPNQLSCSVFPQRQYGKKTVVKRSFQQQWFQNVTNDIVFCHTCVKAVQFKRLSSPGSADMAFISRGYCNWKGAVGNSGAFCKHESSRFHKEAFQVMYPHKGCGRTYIIQPRQAKGGKQKILAENSTEHTILGKTRATTSWRW